MRFCAQRRDADKTDPTRAASGPSALALFPGHAGDGDERDGYDGPTIAVGSTRTWALAYVAAAVLVGVTGRTGLSPPWAHRAGGLILTGALTATMPTMNLSTPSMSGLTGHATIAP